MEPAVERREHVGGCTGGVMAELAAMEPAVERREHRLGVNPGARVHARPQWSPPLKGGSMPYRPVVTTRAIRPQWSPPLKGGSTPARGCTRNRKEPAAMEPAVERREHRSIMRVSHGRTSAPQ